MKPLFRIKQTKYTPIILLVLIMAGFLFGKQQNKGTMDQEMDQKEQTSNVENLEPSTEDVTDNNQFKEEKISDSKDETIDTDNYDSATDADIALDTGENISDIIESEYVREVINSYCNRKVVACTSSQLVREEGELWFQQTFAHMSGYMNLVKLIADKDTTFKAKISTDMSDVTVAMLLSDSSYIVIDKNSDFECLIPEGESIIFYIGEDISGSIRIDIKNNENIRMKRM